MAPETVVGWDLGGAHLKAARLGPDGDLRVYLEPSPLARGPEEAKAAMEAVLGQMGAAPHHLLTMTGELADCFPDRDTGVRALVECARERLGEGAAVDFYSRRGILLSPQEARARPEEVASANWHATALAAARSLADVLVVDIGSTTSDLIPVGEGAVRAVGDSDAARLRAGELLYTGVVRTPVMALGGRVPVAGDWVPLTAEWFAGMADVHRLRGALPEGADPGPTADGGPANAEGSALRLARMVGRDPEPGDLAPWRHLADYLGELQLRSLLDGAYQTLGRSPLPAGAPVVGAGVGRFLAAEMAGRLGRPYLDFNELVPAAVPGCGPTPADCAPAVSLAVLTEGARW